MREFLLPNSIESNKPVLDVPSNIGDCFSHHSFGASSLLTSGTVSSCQLGKLESLCHRNMRRKSHSSSSRHHTPVRNAVRISAFLLPSLHPKQLSTEKHTRGKVLNFNSLILLYSPRLHCR